MNIDHTHSLPPAAAPDSTAARFAVATIAIGVAVLALKLAAARLTGSVALWSDALESIVNVVAAAGTLIAIRVAARPPDASHMFGHGKAEYLSAVAEGVLIVVAAIAILQEAWTGLAHPRRLEAPASGLLLNAAASLLNGVWAATLLRAGRRLRSPALSADGRHLLTDVATSAGVLAGVWLAAATGIPWLDPALAAAVGVYVIWAGWRVVSHSIGGLMDAAPDETTLTRLRATIAATIAAEPAFGYHGLRARTAGRVTFIEFVLSVPGALPVATAHRCCDALEAALGRELPGARVVIHVEPASRPA
ncbi:MAG: cation diffusion facilitator family transporter [Lautropia sp.]